MSCGRWICLVLDESFLFWVSLFSAPLWPSPSSDHKTKLQGNPHTSVLLCGKRCCCCSCWRSAMMRRPLVASERRLMMDGVLRMLHVFLTFEHDYLHLTRKMSTCSNILFLLSSVTASTILPADILDLCPFWFCCVFKFWCRGVYIWGCLSTALSVGVCFSYEEFFKQQTSSFSFLLLSNRPATDVWDPNVTAVELKVPRWENDTFI